jgi:hypothetical protein
MNIFLLAAVIGGGVFQAIGLLFGHKALTTA